jgi:hypothetical protein
MKTIDARKLRQTVTEKTPGLEITLHAEREDEDPRDHFASGDDADDEATASEIIARANNGEVWAWCFVRVTATYRGVSAFDTLGGCSYENEKEFREGGYYEDMVFEVLKQLNAQLEAIDACELAPHHRAIIACACGYKRTEGHGR